MHSLKIRLPASFNNKRNERRRQQTINLPLLAIFFPMNNLRRVSIHYDDALKWDFDHQWRSGLTQHERIYGLANRFLHSTAYKVGYVVLALFSLICVIITFANPCPSGFYIFMEYVINFALVLEVGVRLLAQRETFFQYWANIFDLALVFFCVMTLIILHRDCSTGNEVEKALDSILLAFRYSVQLFRFLMMLKRNQFNMAQRANFVSIQDDVESAHARQQQQQRGLLTEEFEDF